MALSCGVPRCWTGLWIVRGVLERLEQRGSALLEAESFRRKPGLMPQPPPQVFVVDQLFQSLRQGW